MQVKEKVKEKKGRSERPRIDEGREAIPSRFDFIVDGIDHVEPSVKLGAVSVGQVGIFGGGVAGEEVNQVHAKQNETFFRAVNFFVRFFFRFFFIFFLTRFLRGKFARFSTKIFVDGRAPGQARIWGKFPTSTHPSI